MEARTCEVETTVVSLDTEYVNVFQIYAGFVKISFCKE
jgi:hypothetical protein